ncbi:MAG: ribonuclease HI family protein [Armatimonadota bacterium]|nr:ribonuclease HI family protein [Armatimonadota bacterium]MDR5704398.1 ribonuclease HI family protein [Armatimonadota bacterium]
MGARVLSCYIDGAARGNPGPAGIGVVVLAQDGTVLREIARYVGETTNNVAEYYALLAALEEALHQGAEEVVIYSDSELLVRQVNGTYRVRSAHLLPLFQRARALMGRLRKVAVRHIGREKNARADRLANRAIDEKLNS